MKHPKLITIPRSELQKRDNRMIKLIAMFAVNALWDEFDFTLDDCERFYHRLELKADSFAKGDITWDEQMSILEDEMQFKINWRDY